MLQPGDIIEGPSGNHYELISKDANGMWTYVQKSDGSVHWGQDFALSTWHLISSKPLTTATAPIPPNRGNIGEVWECPKTHIFGLTQFVLVSFNYNTRIWDVKHVSNGGHLTFSENLSGMTLVGGSFVLKPPPSVPQYINYMFANYINSSYVGQPTVDLKHYPHKCPRCSQPAYVGIVPNSIDCSNKSCIIRS